MEPLKQTIRVRIDEPTEHYSCQRCSFQTSKKHCLLDHYRNAHDYPTNVVFYCGQCEDEFVMLKDCNFHFAHCDEVPTKRRRAENDNQDDEKEIKEEELIDNEEIEELDEGSNANDRADDDEDTQDRIDDAVNDGAENADSSESNTNHNEEVNDTLEEGEHMNLNYFVEKAALYESTEDSSDPDVSAEAEDVDGDDAEEVKPDMFGLTRSQSSNSWKHSPPPMSPEPEATDVEALPVQPADPLPPFSVLIDLPAVQLKFECPICGSDCYQRSAVINHCRTSHHRDCAVSFRCSGCKEQFVEQKDCLVHTRGCEALREELERSDRQRVRHRRSSGRDGSLLTAATTRTSKGSKSPVAPKLEDEAEAELPQDEDEEAKSSTSSAREDDEAENEQVECNIRVPVEGSRSIYSCPNCIYTAYVRSELTYHFKAKHGGPPRILFVCRGCELAETDFKIMTRHFAECEPLQLLDQRQSRERRSITHRSEQHDAATANNVAAESSADAHSSSQSSTTAATSKRQRSKAIEMLCEFPRTDDAYKCPRCGRLFSRRYMLEDHCQAEHGVPCECKYRCTYCKNFFESSHQCVSHLKNCVAKQRHRQKAEAASGNGKTTKSQQNGEKSKTATASTSAAAATIAPTDRKTRAAQQQPVAKDPVDLNYPNSDTVANVVYFNVPMRGKHECPKCAQGYVKRSQFNAHFSKHHLAGQECITYYRCVGCRANFELQRICNEHTTHCEPCDPYRRAFLAYCAARDQTDDQRPMADVVAEAMADERRLGPSFIPQLNELRNIVPASERQRNRNIAAVADRRNWEPLFYEEFGKIIARQPASGPQFVALMPLILELTGNVVRSLAFPNHR